jgi:hypothetical protein
MATFDHQHPERPNLGENHRRTTMKHTTLFIFVLCLSFISGCIPATPQPCSVEYLISKINDANATPFTTDVIDLSAGCTYQLKQVNNLFAGANGLPVITSPIVIKGNGAVIMRVSDAPEQFRLFYIQPIGNLELSDMTLTGGSAYNPADPGDLLTNGGGAILNLGHLAVYKSRITENTAREGGGIDNRNQMTLSFVTVDSNNAFGGLKDGAGLHNRGIATIENSTFSNNGLVGETTDGIFTNGTLEMTNSTVSGNGVTGIDNEGEVTLNHVTIAFNGVGAFASCGDLTISNSIIAQPPGTSGCSCQTIHPVFPNLDTTGTCAGMLVNMNALQLGPLADNNGRTQTHALLPGSIAIDFVVRMCLPIDQRGVPRPHGPKCDVGAYEYTGVLAPMLNITDTPSTQACTFTAKLSLNCRSSPGISTYPVVDFFDPGQSAQVSGQSPDEQFLYVTGPNTGLTCAVPGGDSYGMTAGDCRLLAVFTPLPPAITPSLEGGTPSSPGACFVGGFAAPQKCVSPCPPGATPGIPCSTP